MDSDSSSAVAPSRALPLSTLSRRLITLGFGLSGAAALIYEVTWTRELSLVFSSTVYAVSMMLAAFMSGLSIGGMLGGRRADKPGADPIRDLATVELGIAAAGLLSPLTIRFLPYLQYELLTQLKPSPPVFFMSQMLLAFLVMIVPTTLMGMTFPLVSKISTTSYGTLGQTVGRLYSANTLGAIGGSLAAGFLLVPLIGVRGTTIAAGVLNMTVAVLIMFAHRRDLLHRLIAGALVMMLLGGIGLALPQPAVPLSFGMAYRFDSYRDYKDVSGENVDTLWEDENAYGRVVVVEDPASGFRFLVNDSLIEGSNDTLDQATTHLLAALPAAYAPQLDDVLVVGLGTGLTSKAALSTSAKSVTTVEINPAMQQASRYFVGELLTDDPRWKLVHADARNYLAITPRRYDVITAEPSWPLASAVAPLFTREFFELASSRLAPGGVMCQWLPEYLLDVSDRTMMRDTFTRVFPGAQAWIVTVDGEPNGDMFLLGTKGGRAPSADKVVSRVDAQLRETGYTNISVVPAPESEFLSDAQNPGRINTDDRPLLEFDVPRALVNMAEGKQRP